MLASETAPEPVQYSDASVRRLLLRDELAQFLYHEAELLDSRQFTEWTELLEDDLVYFMPVRRNVRFGEHAEHENTRQGEGISWFDEDKWTLCKRVSQIMTGDHYAEEPLSRVCRIVSNVQLIDDVLEVPVGGTVSVRSRMLVYQNRNQYETYMLVGKRTDQLRRTADGWKLARREILLDQNVLLAKNLTVFL
jgi:3-phenylpropionate/cinnamic acid dioxygenase small subunit